MRRIILSVILITAMVALAQEKTSLVVKDSSTATGVVIVTGVMGAQSVELQCNQNSPSCVPLKSGKYIMVVLAKNMACTTGRTRMSIQRRQIRTATRK